MRVARTVFAPQRAIAGTLLSLHDELRLLRTLYELDLASRTPPVLRETEPARKDDTEVSNMNDEDSPVPKWKRGWAPVDEDES
jgi:hypothetical protein